MEELLPQTNYICKPISGLKKKCKLILGLTMDCKRISGLIN
jgi:hypothetical protein